MCRMSVVRSTLAVLMMFAVAAGNAVRADEQPSKSLYQKTLRSVVWIKVPMGKGFATGTGWIADRSKRLIVTNHHVVESQERVTLLFPQFKNGKLVVEKSAYNEEPGLRAKVLDTDIPRDLAVLQLTDAMPEGSEELKLAGDSPEPGDHVHSIGNPGASDALWVYTSGTVRAVYKKEWPALSGRSVLERKCRIVETQSPVNHGDSGGPVVNDKGELVAVVSSGMTRDQNNKAVQLMTWHIEIGEVKEFVEQTRRLMDPKTAADYALRGQRLYERSRFNDAIEDFTAAIKMDKKNAAAYRGRSLALCLKGDHDTAILDCTEAIKLDEDDAVAFENRGRAYARKGDQEKAIADYSKAIQLNPKFALAYNNRGFVYYTKRDFNRAFADYNRAVEADPKFAVALLNCGDVLNDLKQYDKSIGYCNRALSLNPFLQNAYNVRGNSLHGMKDYDGAIANYNDALQIYPTNPNFHVQRGLALTWKNRWNEAVADYDKAIEIDPDFAAAYFWRGSAYEAQGDDAKSQPYYQKAIQLNPKYADEVKVQDRRHIRIVNQRDEPIRVFLHYESRDKKGEWGWYPDDPGGKSFYYDIPPGKSTELYHDDYHIKARRVRLWATGQESNKSSLTYKDKDLWIVPKEGYRARKETTFTYTYTK